MSPDARRALQADLDAQRERCELLQESMQRLESEVAPDEPPGLPFMLRGKRAEADSAKENGDDEDCGAAALPASAGSASTLAAANSALTRKVIQLSEHFSRRVLAGRLSFCPQQPREHMPQSWAALAGRTG